MKNSLWYLIGGRDTGAKLRRSWTPFSDFLCNGPRFWLAIAPRFRPQRDASTLATLRDMTCSEKLENGDSASTSRKPVFPPIPFKQAIHFGELDSSRFIGQGWSHPEGWGRWTNAKTSEVRFSLEDFNRDMLYVLKFQYNLFSPPQIKGGQRVKISLNGKHLWDISSVVNDGRLTLEFPGSYLAHQNVLVFESSAPTSPHELGIGPDIRQIALALSSLSIEPARAPREELPTSNKKMVKVPVVINKADHALISEAGCDIFDHAVGNVTVTKYDPEEITLEVSSPTDAWLFSSERYSRSWSAWVNGVPVEIQRANFCFRAVQVPSGVSQVRFVYNPSFLWPLLLVSLGTVCVVTIVGVSSGERMATSR